MPRAVALSKVVKDPNIFPRGKVDQDAVIRYRDAYELNETLPPIILEKNTYRLLDGWHRVAALEEIGAEKVSVEFHEVPLGVAPLLYAAGLSSRHGVILSNREKSEIAKRIYGADDETPIPTISQQLAVSERTVYNWLDDLIKAKSDQEKHKSAIRQGAVALIAGAGLTQQEMADIFAVSQQQITSDCKVADTCKTKLLTDAGFLAEVLTVIPERHQEHAKALLDAWTEEVAEEVEQQKAQRVATELWRSIEAATGDFATWLNKGAPRPTAATPERVHYIITTLQTCVTKLEENNDG